LRSTPKSPPAKRGSRAKAGASVEKLGLVRIREILAGSGRAALAKLVAKDADLAPEFQAVADVERLARYHRYLCALLHNYVNFATSIHKTA
jgi:hypothetical protein